MSHKRKTLIQNKTNQELLSNKPNTLSLLLKYLYEQLKSHVVFDSKNFHILSQLCCVNYSYRQMTYEFFKDFFELKNSLVVKVSFPGATKSRLKRKQQKQCVAFFDGLYLSQSQSLYQTSIVFSFMCFQKIVTFWLTMAFSYLLSTNTVTDVSTINFSFIILFRRFSFSSWQRRKQIEGLTIEKATYSSLLFSLILCSPSYFILSSFTLFSSLHVLNIYFIIFVLKRNVIIDMERGEYLII